MFHIWWIPKDNQREIINGKKTITIPWMTSNYSERNQVQIKNEDNPPLPNGRQPIHIRSHKPQPLSTRVIIHTVHLMVSHTRSMIKDWMIHHYDSSYENLALLIPWLMWRHFIIYNLGHLKKWPFLKRRIQKSRGSSGVQVTWHCPRFGQVPSQPMFNRS